MDNDASGASAAGNGPLQGRTALVTGSLDGIGFAIATALARRGCAVVLHGPTASPLANERLAELRTLGIEADYGTADLSLPAEIDELVTFAQRRFGAIDILVNNAVTRHDASVDELPVDKWNNALAVNLSAPFHLTRLVLPAMKARRFGRIINLASIYGVEGTPRRLDYVATKHGLVGMTKVVALETAEFGITCNALCPGAVLTPAIRARIDEEMRASGRAHDDVTASFLAARQPSKRFVLPERVGDLAAFLCSDAACDITGTPIPIDGGWQARA